MYEITHGGVWFKWSSLDWTDKWLAGIAIVTAIGPAALLGVGAGEYGYRVGYWLGSNGRWPDTARYEALYAISVFPTLMLGALLLSVVCFATWWRFSLRQDEHFNRIQNDALGRSSAWTLAAAAAWWALWLGGWAEEPPLPVLLLISLVLFIVFWFRAVRKWA